MALNEINRNTTNNKSCAKLIIPWIKNWESNIRAQRSHSDKQKRVMRLHFPVTTSKCRFEAPSLFLKLSISQWKDEIQQYKHLPGGHYWYVFLHQELMVYSHKPAAQF